MKHFARKLIPEGAKAILRSYLRSENFPGQEELKGKKKVIITLGGFYQNLGDMALTFAQKQMIKDVLPDHQVVYLSSNDTYKYMRSLKKIVGPDDIITINGGGNMDDMYLSLENARRFIVKSFPQNPIISFPQTIAFSNTLQGKRELQKSASTYGAHSDMTIFAREFPSADVMKKNFSSNSIHVSPDVVLSLELEKPTLERCGIMITLRKDLERKVSESERRAITQVAEKKTEKVSVHDMVEVSLEDCQPETYEATLRRFWNQITSHKIVITDRLHGMIFCVITRTPVVVLANSNHKIKGTYEAWLREHNYVQFIESFDLDKITSAIDFLWNLSDAELEKPNLFPEFGKLRRSLQQAAWKNNS